MERRFIEAECVCSSGANTVYGMLDFSGERPSRRKFEQKHQELRNRVVGETNGSRIERVHNHGMQAPDNTPPDAQAHEQSTSLPTHTFSAFAVSKLRQMNFSTTRHVRRRVCSVLSTVAAPKTRITCPAPTNNAKQCTKEYQPMHLAQYPKLSV